MAELETIAPEQIEQQGPPDRLRVLYDAVSKDYNIGSYDEFSAKLKDPVKRRAFYDGVGAQYQLGNYADFERKIAPSGLGGKIDSVAGLLEASGIKTAAQKHAEELASAQTTLKNTWANITPVAQKALVEDKNKAALSSGQAQVQQIASDASRVAGVPSPVPFPQATPTTSDEVEQYKANPQNEGYLLYRQINAHKEAGDKKAADELQAATYAAKSAPRAGGREEKITNNINAIRRGELQYSPISDRLIKPTGLGESISDAWAQRQKDIAMFDAADKDDDATLISKLNKEIAGKDPDDPVHVPEGATGHIGEAAGSMGAPGAAALAVGWVPGIGEAAAGGIMAHEMARRSAGQELVRMYADAKAKGASDEEALAAAKKQATVGMYTGAVTGGLMGAAGSKAGAVKLPPAPSGMLRAAADKAFNFLKQETPAALAQGAIGGAGEVAKNVAADRPVGEGVGEAALTGMAYTYAFGALAKLGAAIPKTAAKLKQGLIKLPPEDIKAIAAEQVEAGIVTPDEAKLAIDTVEQQRAADEQIPDKVVSEEVRMRLQRRLARRTELEEEAKKVGKPFQPEIKEKIAKLDEEINEIANSKEAKTEAVEPESVPREAPEGQPVAPKSATDLINEGIASGKIPEEYKPFAEHPEHLIDGIKEQLKSGNEAELRTEFGDELVDLVKTKTSQDAKTIRSDQGQTDQGGQIGEGGENLGSEDIQSSQVAAPDNGETAKQAGGQPEVKPKRTAPVLDEAQQAQADYAYKNSYREFVKKYPEINNDDYNRLRGVKYNQIRASQTSGQHEVFYENIMASQPNESGRIPVDPIVGEKPKQISTILADASKGLHQKIAYQKPGRARAAGSYSSADAAVRLRNAGNLDVAAHEIGHALDDRFGVLKDLPPHIEQELASFSSTGSTPPEGHPNPQQYINAEGFAEWLRAYIVNPEIAKAAAPETFKLYQAKSDAAARAAVETLSKDIRTFAGASGRGMTLANIQWEPTKAQGLMKRFLSKSNNDEMFAISWADKLAANFLDPMQAFNKAFEYAKGLKGLDEVLPAEDPTILARLFLSIDRKFGEQLETGLRDGADNLRLSSDGEPMTMSWLLGAFDNTDKGTIVKEMQDATAYMVAQRTVELAARMGRESQLTGAGGGVFKDLDVANKTIAEMKSNPAHFGRIEEAARRYREFADGILQYLVDKGRLSEEAYKEIKENNDQYVAMQRVMEAAPDQESTPSGGAGGKLGSKGEPIKAIKGSTRTIANPYVSLLDGMYKSIKEADRNEVLQAFNNMLRNDRTMHEGEPTASGEVGMLGKAGDKNAVISFRDGKAEHWVYHPEVYKALKGLDNDGYKLPGLLTLHARLLRGMTTKFPTFAVRNWIRDIQDRLIKSNDASGFRDLYGDKEHWQDVARKGGLNSGYYMRDRAHYYGLMEEAVKDLSKKGVHFSPTKLWHGYENILSKSETSNRVAEYRAGFRAAKAKGMDDYNAGLYGAFKSRDLMDFAVMGHYMKVINQIIPFSNAAVQGIRSSAVRLRQKPAAFLGRMAVYTVLPQATLWFWNHRNKEAGDEYENLPGYQRDMFWNVKIGDNKWLSIPKPYELGMLASGVDRGLSKAWGNDEAYKGYAGSLANSLSPIDESSLAQAIPGVEEQANWDFFREKTIIPPDQDALDLSLRHTETASRLGKAMQGMSGWDARKWDHFIRSQFSYTGNLALKLSDVGSGNSRTAFDLSDLGTFKESPAYNSPAVQELLEYAKRWNLTRSKPYREFSAMAGDYFNAPDDATKDEKAKELIDFSKHLLDSWKRANVDEIKKERFKARAGGK